jgi:hypothetical protein
MNMPKFVAIAICCLSIFLCAPPLSAQDFSAAVMLREAGFPAADSPSLSPEQLNNFLPRARFASADQLGTFLSEPATRLLVLPYGSAFPEQSWSAIFSFLQRGGSLQSWQSRRFARCPSRPR